MSGRSEIISVKVSATCSIVCISDDFVPATGFFGLTLASVAAACPTKKTRLFALASLDYGGLGAASTHGRWRHYPFSGNNRH